MFSRAGTGRSAISALLVAARLGLAACCLVFGPAVAGQQSHISSISGLIDPAAHGAPALRSASDVREFYASRQFAPAWTDDNQISDAIAILHDSGSDGLDPAVFRLHTILADRKAHSQRKTVAFDVLLTDAMLTYIHEMSGSRVNPLKVNGFIALPPPIVSASEILGDALKADALKTLPDKLAPAHPEYALLRTALAQLRAKNPKSPHIAQIIANMERWRWLPRPFPDFYVAVNSADSTLHLVKDKDIVFSTLLVTGKRSTPTPLFATVINAVTINPSWDVPGDIAVREIRPKEVRDPGYLQSHDIVADRPGGALRQLPGPDNVLGRFLLEMPNVFDAYLHDTPKKDLFGEAERHYSHGCMRVDNMEALASLLLAQDGSDPSDNIHETVDSGQTQTEPLTQPVPVYVLYWTVVPGSDGSLAFRKDVYGWDAAVLAALARH